MDNTVLAEFARDMRIANYSPVTITDRMKFLYRFVAFLGGPLLAATSDDLRAFQAQFIHLAPASTNIYARHVKAFYDWAERRHLIERNPADEIVVPKVPPGRPHPTAPEDMQRIFAVTRGPLRTAYVLAAFAGLRCGEICRLHRRDLLLAQREPTALVHGKGRKERIVPLLGPVVSELEAAGLSSGWVLQRDGGAPFAPKRLSVDSSVHLHGLGLPTTLHSMRGYFATHTARVTHDPMFVRDLLGHESVRTTEVYIQTSVREAHNRLASFASEAAELLESSGRPARWLHSVPGA